MDEMNEILTTLMDEMRSTAVHAVDSLFDVHSFVRDDWAIEERLSGEYDHIITLGCSNSDYQGVVMIASLDENIESFFDEKDEAYDIFGELANTYCGMLMDQKKVVDAFDVLEQAVPMYAAKRAFFPRAWAVTGRVYVDDCWIQVGFAIRGFMMMINR